MQTNTTKNRKKQIEEKATFLFRQRGYAATSMRDLAQELNIEAASLYSHIKSKEEILRGICFKMASLFFKALENVENNSNDLKPEEQLRKAIVEHTKVVTQDVAASAVFFNEWRHLSEPYLSEFIRLREQYELRFIHILNRGKVKKEFKMVDEKLAAQFILSSINWTYSWYKPEGRMSPNEIGHELSNFIIDGIKNNQVMPVHKI